MHPNNPLLYVMSDLVSVLWNVCYQSLEKINPVNEKCLLSFVEGWRGNVVYSLGVYKKKKEKINMNAQRERHVFAQWKEQGE